MGQPAPISGGNMKHRLVGKLLVLGMAILIFIPVSGEQSKKPRARDLGIPFDGTPGPLNAITDVMGIEVGHTTLISGEGKLVMGKGPVRTGVTAILPRGKTYDPVFAGVIRSSNGNIGTTSMILYSPTFFGHFRWLPKPTTAD